MWQIYQNAKIMLKTLVICEFICTNIFVNCDLCTQWVFLSLLINLIIIICSEEVNWAIVVLLAGYKKKAKQTLKI